MHILSKMLLKYYGFISSKKKIIKQYTVNSFNLINFYKNNKFRNKNVPNF